jgi:hypothetical protein
MGASALANGGFHHLRRDIGDCETRPHLAGCDTWRIGFGLPELLNSIAYNSGKVIIF